MLVEDHIFSAKELVDCKIFDKLKRLYSLALSQQLIHAMGTMVAESWLFIYYSEMTSK